MLMPTPPHLLLDREGRPYFLWDIDMTLDELKEKIVEIGVSHGA